MTVHRRTRSAACRLWSIAAVWAVAQAGGYAQAQRLTVDRLTTSPQLAGTPPIRPAWSPDGKRLAFLWDDQARPFRDVWIVDAGGGVPARLTRLSADAPSGRGVPAPPSTPIGLASGYPDEGVSEVIWTPDGQSLLFTKAGTIFRVGLDATAPVRVPGATGGAHAIDFSPDGRYLSYLSGGDLWLSDRGADAINVTQIGMPPLGIIPRGDHSRPEREFNSYRWSSTRRYVALSYEDRRKVRVEDVPNYLAEETEVIRVRRDRLGDTDLVRQMAIYSVADGRLRWIELPDATRRRFSGFSWSPDGSSLLVDQNSEDATHRWLYVVDPEKMTFRQVWQDHRETRTTRLWYSGWQSTGKGVIFTSDLSGRHRLHALRLGDLTQTQLTFGDWSVVGESSAATVTVSSTGRIFFVSTEKNPYERQVYSMPEAGGPVTQLTGLPGTHQPYVAPEGTWVATLHSNDVTPTELYVVSTRTPKAERRVTRSPARDFADYPWVQPRYVTFKNRTDGVTLHGRLFEPPGLDRTRKYPVILGPVYSNSVRNMWLDRREWRGFYSSFQQYLAIECGYIAFSIDVRGSVGHGREFRDRLLRGYGTIDVDDLLSGVEYLKTLPYVDSNRIGIWGSSYGGLLTTMSLFKHPGVFKAGVASAPATNLWHARPGISGVARRPQEHPDAYRQSSSFMHADGLRDHLMIVHGIVDDIVLFKDSMVLVEKLMMLGKDVDFVVAPSSVHGWSEKPHVAKFLLGKILEHFDRYLGRGPK